jgi:DNA-binding IclR family transcriptional regulator
MPREAKNPVAATQRSLRLIELLRRDGPSTVTELAGEVEMTKGAVHHHLSTLAEFGYVVNDGGTYRLGLTFLEIGGYLRHQLELYRSARVELDRAAERCGELALLMVEEDGVGVYLYHTSGHGETYVDTYAGRRVPLHWPALGKAILAHQSPEVVDRIVRERGLEPATEQTITDAGALERELETVRERGYATDAGEYIRGIDCVARPLLSDDRQVQGAVGFAGPSSRMDEERIAGALLPLLDEVQNVVEVDTNVWGDWVS